MNGSCEVCGRVEGKACSGCRGVFYCGKEHQQLGWKTGHKQECGWLRVETSPEYGRYLVAAKHIPKGQVILREKPLVLGPKMYSEPLCLGCLKTLEHREYYLCSSCGWPLCSAECEGHLNHVTECRVMSAKKFRPNIKFKGTSQKEAAYSAIAPLRCLLLEEIHLKRLLDLESHIDQRKDTQLYKILRNNVGAFIRKILQMNTSEERILEVAGILDTNCFEVRRGKVRARGLYPRAALLAHDCIPRTWHTFGEDLSLVLVTSVDIPEGEMVTATYTQTILGTISRREALLGSKCFLCTCARCQDPTELGTFMGCMVCWKCRRDTLTPSRPLDPASAWCCPTCNEKVPFKAYSQMDKKVEEEIKRLDKTSITQLKECFRRYVEEKLLHATNYHSLHLKYAICEAYGNDLEDQPEEGLEERLTYLKELEEVADKIEPGDSRLRGLLLLHIQTTRLAIIKRQLGSGHKGSELAEVRSKYEDVGRILKVDSELLKLVNEGINNVDSLLTHTKISTK